MNLREQRTNVPTQHIYRLAKKVLTNKPKIRIFAADLSINSSSIQRKLETNQAKHHPKSNVKTRSDSKTFQKTNLPTSRFPDPIQEPRKKDLIFLHQLRLQLLQIPQSLKLVLLLLLVLLFFCFPCSAVFKSLPSTITLFFIFLFSYFLICFLRWWHIV